MVGFIKKDSSLTQCAIITKGNQTLLETETQAPPHDFLILSKVFFTEGFWIIKPRRWWQDYQTLPGKALSPHCSALLEMLLGWGCNEVAKGCLHPGFDPQPTLKKWGKEK